MTNLHYLRLGSVKITDEECRAALDREIGYLLSLDANRLLSGFFENAGIPTSYKRYGGWENTLIGGHTLGHYLSALSQAYVNGGTSPHNKELLYSRMKEIASKLELCQNNSRGKEGFLWGAVCAEEDVEAQFDHVERGETDIEREAWVPWYTMHKLLAGLCDGYVFGGIPEFLGVAEKLGRWVAERVSHWDEETRARVLSVEYGGMNDALCTLYELTGEGSFFDAAHIFDEEPLFDKILTEGDVLEGLHANTTIPKIVGALHRHIILQARGEEDRYLRVAEAFFRIVTERHTYATGGNSEAEFFGRDYALNSRRTNANCETCNVYNMLKLARGLFLCTGDKGYSDYYDIAFTNAIMGSRNKKTGMTTYFQPMAGGYFKVFSSPYDSFWCCTGTGMENFTKLGDAAFARRGEELLIERYLSADCEEDGIGFSLECAFPDSEEGIFRLKRAEKPVSVLFRIPDWADGSVQFFGETGEPIQSEEAEGHAAVTLREGESVRFRIPLTVTMKGLPDGHGTFAFFCGNTLLAADLGAEDMRETTTGVNVRIPARAVGSEELRFASVERLFSSPASFFEREGDTFRLRGADRELTFRPYSSVFDRRYAVYFRILEGIPKKYGTVGYSHP